jgi:hypothetical protein
VAWVLLIGCADAFAQQRFVYSGVTAGLSRQQRMADRLHAALEPGETVYSLSYVWYPALTGDDNALPIRWFGGKADILEASGCHYVVRARASGLPGMAGGALHLHGRVRCQSSGLCAGYLCAQG